MSNERKNKRKTVINADTVLEGKMIPNAIELEEAVLGALLLEKGGLDAIAKDFSTELFYKEQNRLVAEAMLEMYHDNEDIDILTVTQKLKSKNKLEHVGGAYYVASLTNRIASNANIEFHIKILQQHSLRRSAIRMCGNTIRKAFDDTEDIFDVYSELQIDMDDSIKQVMHYEVATISEVHQKNIEESLAVAEGGEKSGVPCGLVMVDNLTSGWQKSDLIILAGRPSMGKTAGAISMVVYPAIEKNIPVAIFELEMSASQLGGRIESNLSHIDVSRIIKKQLDVSEIRYVEKCCEPLKKAPLYIDDTPNISLIELKSKARRLVREKGVKLIVIDYLQLMRSGLNIQNREQEIAEISRGLKGLAKELDIPIIALSQLSRLVEGRADKKPQLSDLRESGQIEQDADMVLFCYRPEYYGATEYEFNNQSIDTHGLFLLIVAKHRNGELGEIPLRFIHQLTKLANHPHWIPEEEEKKTEVSTNPYTSATSAIPQNNDFLSQRNDTQASSNSNDEGDIDLPF